MSKTANPDALSTASKGPEMAPPPVQFHTMSGGERIAFRYHPGAHGDGGAESAGPLLVFLPGYMSDMDGGKARAIMAEAQAHGRPCLLLDYSGCGRSDGAFADGTLSRWRDEVLAVIAARQAEGAPREILLVGSSMGGWLMILVGEALANGGGANGDAGGAELAAMIGIAAAPDFTSWGYSEAQRAALAAGEVVYEDNPYGPDPTPTHPGFFADAQQHLRLDQGIAITCRVDLLHGQCDADVPWDVSLQHARALRSDAVQVSLIKDGDHRLSRDSDIALLKRVVATHYQRYQA